MNNSTNVINQECFESTISDMPKNIAYCILANVAGFFWSRPGAGKSETFKQVAKALGYHLVDLRLSQIESIDLRGLPLKSYSYFKLDKDNNIIGKELDESLKLSKEASVTWAMPDFLVEARKARENGLNTIFLFDELNHADDSNQAAAYQFILEKKVGCFQLHEDDRVFAAGNYEGEGSIANPMSLALANRMNHYYVKPDARSWCKWARLNNLEPLIIAYVEKNPTIFDRYPDEDGSGKDKGWPTPRTLKKCSDLYTAIVRKQNVVKDMFSFDSMINDEDLEAFSDFYNMIKENTYGGNENDIMHDLEVNLSGSIGMSSSLELMTYIKIGHELPDPYKILNGEIDSFSFESQKDRVDIQCVSSNQLISAILFEYDNLKKLHNKLGVKNISRKTDSEELEKAKKDFYAKYDNLVKFTSKNFNPDLFILTVVTKIIREFDIHPLPLYIDKETFSIVRDSFRQVTSKNF